MRFLISLLLYYCLQQLFYLFYGVCVSDFLQALRIHFSVQGGYDHDGDGGDDDVYGFYLISWLPSSFMKSLLSSSLSSFLYVCYLFGHDCFLLDQIPHCHFQIRSSQQLRFHLHSVQILQLHDQIISSFIQKLVRPDHYHSFIPKNLNQLLLVISVRFLLYRLLQRDHRQHCHVLFSSVQKLVQLNRHLRLMLDYFPFAWHVYHLRHRNHHCFQSQIPIWTSFLLCS